MIHTLYGGMKYVPKSETDKLKNKLETFMNLTWFTFIKTCLYYLMKPIYIYIYIVQTNLGGTNFVLKVNITL